MSALDLEIAGELTLTYILAWLWFRSLTRVFSQGYCLPTSHRHCQHRMPNRRRPTRGRPPIKRRLGLESDHQYSRTSRSASLGPKPPATPAPSRVPELATGHTFLKLTIKRLLDLLAQSPGGVVSLKWASQVLGVHRWRIYQITNVLAGINLISKTSRTHIQWLGNRIDGASKARLQELQRETSELTEAEEKLDELINECSLQLQLLKEDTHNKKLGYITWQDLSNTVNPLDQIMVFRTPPETQVQVSESSEGYQISLKSSNVPIDMFLCLEDSSGVCSPVTDCSPAKASCRSPPQSDLVSQEVSSSPLPLSTDFESFLDFFSGICEMPDFDSSPLGSSDFLLECGGAADSIDLLLDGFPCLSPPHSQEYHFDLSFDPAI